MTHSISNRGLVARALSSFAVAGAVLACGSAFAAVPGITGGTGTTATFNLSASPGFTSQPDGVQVYTWGYGCGAASTPGTATPGVAPAKSTPAGFLPANLSVTPSCGLMQLPGPTLIVTEGQTVTVNLYNGLPAVAGNTSIVFSGFATTATAVGPAAAASTPATVPAAAPFTLVAPAGANYANASVTYATGTTVGTAGTALTLVTGAPTAQGQYSFAGGTYTFNSADAGASVVIAYSATTTAASAAGKLVAEAAPGTTVTYTFTASKPGTYAYYSGSRPELQIDMGLYGALVVLPKTPYSGTTGSTACAGDNLTLRGLSGGTVGGTDYRNSTSAYDHPETCYDREFLFQFAEFDSNVHQAVQACVEAGSTACPQLDVVTDPFHPNYFVINGRSFPDDEDPNYAPMYPNQPYNGDPQIHPGETMLLRVVGQGRMQHPFHIHANHGRVLGRDGNLLLSANDPQATTLGYSRLAGPLYYTVPTVPGQGQDLVFTYTAKGLNWDMYGHGLNANPPLPIGPTLANNPASDPTPCYPDANGFYTINSTPPASATATNYYEWCADHNKPIPITPPDPQIVANGLWYGGTPYMGLAQIPLGGGAPQFLSTPLPPGTTIQNPSAGYAYMWHSHAERELTTNNVFPGGMLMMLVVQPPSTPIDETN